jgi:hypothetical protein
MHQSNLYRYEVEFGEAISLLIEPVGVPFLVAGMLDGRSINLSEGNEFRFMIDKQPGSTHFLVLEFQFLPDSPENPRYAVELKSSEGPPYPFSVSANDQVKDISIKFHVISGSGSLGIKPPKPWT